MPHQQAVDQSELHDRIYVRTSVSQSCTVEVMRSTGANTVVGSTRQTRKVLALRVRTPPERARRAVTASV